MAKTKLDLTSPDPVLFFREGSTADPNIPARDLTAADLSYLHRVRALQKSGGEPVTAASPSEIEKLADELHDSGSYLYRAPADHEPSSPASEPLTEAPATPADKE
ncbi:MAG TPA: hypothetical protein VIL81_09335 [Candidatus Limnocylindrales bacterium]